MGIWRATKIVREQRTAKRERAINVSHVITPRSETLPAGRNEPIKKADNPSPRRDAGANPHIKVRGGRDPSLPSRARIYARSRYQWFLPEQ